MTKLGLVTVLFNSNEVIEGFFKSLSIQNFKEYHLYLIDNTPGEVSDSLISELTNRYNITQYTHVKNNENVGVAEGNNQGIRLSLLAGSTHTLLLNNDIEFEQVDLLQGMYDYSVQNSEKIIVPKILFFDSRKIWTASGSFNRLSAVTTHTGEGIEDQPRYNINGYSNYAPTCFMLIDNKIFKQIGIMDPKYFVYYDDTDFVYRAVKAGYLVFYLSKYTVLHKVSSLTGGSTSPFTVYWSNRNRIYFIRKNYGLFFKSFSLSYTLATRVYKYLGYDNTLRKKMLQGVIDGLNLKL